MLFDPPVMMAMLLAISSFGSRASRASRALVRRSVRRTERLAPAFAFFHFFIDKPRPHTARRGLRPLHGTPHGPSEEPKTPPSNMRGRSIGIGAVPASPSVRDEGSP